MTTCKLIKSPLLVAHLAVVLNNLPENDRKLPIQHPVRAMSEDNWRYDPFLDLKQVSQRLNCNVVFLKSLIRKGKGPPVRVLNDLVCIKLSSLEAWLAQTEGNKNE
jgi:hypothetical protein